MKKTGVFATKPEIEMVWESYQRTEGAPMIFPNGIKSAELMDEAIEEHRCMIDRLAKKHGLPERPLVDGQVDHYGMMGTGEFVTADE